MPGLSLNNSIRGRSPRRFFTEAVLDRMGKEKRAIFSKTFAPLKKAYPGKVFVLPTSDAMVLAAKHFVQGKLPEIEGIHSSIGKKKRSLWKDQLGHLGPGLERLEGYVCLRHACMESRPKKLVKRSSLGEARNFQVQTWIRCSARSRGRPIVKHPDSGVAPR